MTPRRLLLAAPFLAIPSQPRAAEVRDTWRDGARGRDIPVLLRLPEVAGPRPMVILSHGLGGSREGLGYLGRALTEAGFVALHLQHPGTDSSILRGGADRSTSFAAAALDVGQAVARLQDGIFAVEEALRRTSLRGDSLAGRLDGARIAVAGHSYGAWVVQHLLGQRIPGGDRGLALPDRRLSAGIALSPLPPRGLPPRIAFSRVEVPILHVTGTRDVAFIDGSTPEDREIPYRSIAAPNQVLAVFEGATHAAFADEPGVGARWTDPTYHARTAALAVLFLRAVLAGDAAARAALEAGAPGVLASGDRFEMRRA